MPTFSSLPAEDKVLLAQSINQLGLHLKPTDAVRPHDCHEHAKHLGRIKSDKKIVRELWGCAICAKLRSANGNFENCTTLASEVLTAFTAHEEVHVLATPAGTQLNMPTLKLELAAIIETLKFPEQSAKWETA